MASFGNWTTEKIDQILKEYDRSGTLPKNNPFFNGENTLRAANLNYTYTDEELAIKAIIMKNILYFSENFAKINTDAGYKLVELFPFQTRILRQLAYPGFRHHIILSGRQIGKCLSGDAELDVVEMYKNDHERIKISDLYYNNIDNKNLFHKIEMFLFKLIYKLK